MVASLVIEIRISAIYGYKHYYPMGHQVFALIYMNIQYLHKRFVHPLPHVTCFLNLHFIVFFIRAFTYIINVRESSKYKIPKTAFILTEDFKIRHLRGFLNEFKQKVMSVKNSCNKFMNFKTHFIICTIK